MVGLFLAGFVLFAVRICLRAGVAGIDVASSPAANASKKLEEAKSNNRFQKQITSFSTGVVGKRVLPAPGAFNAATRVAMMRIIGFVDFLIALWGSAVVMLISFILVIALLFTVVAGAIFSGVIDIGDITSVSQTSAESGTKSETEDTTEESSVGGGSTAVPENMDPEEWAKADDTGQKFASTAITSSIMPFPGTSGDINNGHLVYQQGNTPVGYYDCGVFISAVYEANGVLQSGEKRTGGPYDFKTMKKSDLQDYRVTSATMSFVKSERPEAIIATMSESGWESKMVPGDIMVSGQHISIYVGKNKDGVQLVAHAGSTTSKTYYDVMLTEKGKMVGLKKLDDSMKRAGEVIIYRPSKFVEG